MASTYTPNLAVEKPGSGDYSGTWDTPVNSNMGTFDTAIGTVQSISLAGGSITLSTAQARSAFLNFNGNLPSNVTVTIPGLSSAPGTTVSGKAYSVQNQCANSSVYTITLTTTVAGQQQICVPPMEVCDVLIEGTNSSQAGSIKFRNLGRVGTYWDYAGSSVPNWVSGCTVPPYLYCDGTTFSSATYPWLSVVLGGTTLPDLRGRYRASYNDGTGRITSGSSTGGVDGNTLYASGGSQTTTLSSQNMPPSPVTSSNSILNSFRNQGTVAGAGITYMVDVPSGTTTGTGGSSLTISIVVGSTSPTNFSNLPPTAIYGITMVRSA